MKIVLLALVFAVAAWAQEAYVVPHNIPGNAPSTLLVMARGNSPTGWAFAITVKIPTGNTATPIRTVMFLAADCKVGKILTNQVGVSACFPVPFPNGPWTGALPPDWYGLSMVVTPEEKRCASAWMHSI